MGGVGRTVSASKSMSLLTWKIQQWTWELLSHEVESMIQHRVPMLLWILMTKPWFLLAQNVCWGLYYYSGTPADKGLKRNFSAFRICVSNWMFQLRCGVIVCVYAHTGKCMCATYRNSSYFILWGKVSYGLGLIKQVNTVCPVSPRGLLVSFSPALKLQVCTTRAFFFLTRVFLVTVLFLWRNTTMTTQNI